MTKKIVFYLMITLLIFSFNVKAVDESKFSVSKSLKVYANIPLYQELEVVKPIHIDDFKNMIEKHKIKEPMIIENVGTLKVKSNGRWRLKLISNKEKADCKLQVRIQGSSEWKDVKNGSVLIRGDKGNHIIKVDLKIILENQNIPVLDLKKIHFDYALVQI